MLRFWMGFVLATSVAVSCAGDDEKRKVHGDEAGAGGEGGGSPFPDAGGSSAGPGGEGGRGGEGGLPQVSGSAGTAVAGGGGLASGGDAGSTSTDAGAGGGGAPGWPSAFCHGGEYYEGGDSGCWECLGVPQTVKLSCVEAFRSKDMLSDGSPIAVRLTPYEKPREALPTKVDVAFLTPNETHSCDMIFNIDAGRYEIDVTAGPDDPAEVIVQPFTVRTVCGDVIELTDSVRFLHADGDNYAITCPDQT